jgi:hypothetical protein
MGGLPVPNPMVGMVWPSFSLRVFWAGSLLVILGDFDAQVERMSEK